MRTARRTATPRPPRREGPRRPARPGRGAGQRTWVSRRDRASARGAAGQNGNDRRLRRAARDDGRRTVEADVDLAAHAELTRHVDPGLDRETGAGEQTPLVAGLVVVEVRAVAVDLHADGV